MKTPFGDVYDLFMFTVSDYRLDTLFNLDEESFEAYLFPWLQFSVNEFKDSKIDLTFDETTKEFDNTLGYQEKSILAHLMMKYWLQRLVNDVLQVNLHVQDREFRVASEAMNLREKSTHLNHVKEQCSQMLNDYGYLNANWDDWFVQEFQGG